MAELNSKNHQDLYTWRQEQKWPRFKNSLSDLATIREGETIGMSNNFPTAQMLPLYCIILKNEFFPITAATQEFTGGEKQISSLQLEDVPQADSNTRSKTCLKEAHTPSIRK